MTRPERGEGVRPMARGEAARARLLNLLGLVSPAANLGFARLAASRPCLRDVRWVGPWLGLLAWGLAILGHVNGAGWLVWTGVGVHFALVLLGLVQPLLFERPARAWIAFGRALGHVTAVPVFALIWYLVVTPTGLLVRAFGKDPLRRRARPEDSYWEPHRPHPPERYDRQF